MCVCVYITYTTHHIVHTDRKEDELLVDTCVHMSPPFLPPSLSHTHTHTVCTEHMTECLWPGASTSGLTP